MIDLESENVMSHMVARCMLNCQVRHIHGRFE
jgi:hypothetical protein